MRKVLVVACVALAIAASLAPPVQASTEQVISITMQDQAPELSMLTAAKPAAIPTAQAKTAPTKESIDKVNVAAGKRSGGASDRRSRSEGASAARIDPGRIYPLLL